MEIVASPMDWTAFDEERWAKFLDTDTGKRLIPKLMESVPPLLEKGETNSILIRSGQVLGYQQVVQSMFALAHPAARGPEPISQEYPNLDDPRHWPKPEPEPFEVAESPQPAVNPETK